MNSKKRSCHIDIAAGIMIIYMVFIHICQKFGFDNTSLWSIMQHCFGFCMPYFFFKGGMFYREKKICFIFRDSIHRLLKPYFVWMTIGIIILFAIRWMQGTTISFGEIIKGTIYGCIVGESVSGNLPLWFLLTLFGVRIMFAVCLYLKIPSKIIPFGCFFIAWGLNVGNYRLPIIIANTFTGTMFYGIGYILQTKQYGIIQSLVAVCLFGFINIFCYTYVGIRKNILIEGYYVLWPIFATSGIILLNNLCLCMEKVSRKHDKYKYIRLLSFLGRHTMPIYVSHWPIINIIKATFGYSI